MMLKIKFTKRWWNKYAEKFGIATNNKIRDHLKQWTSYNFGRIKPTETDKFGALLLYDAQNKASKKKNTVIPEDR